MSPECIHNKDSTQESDIYSLGGTFFQIISGFPPYLGKSEYILFTQSLTEDPVFVDEIWNDIPEAKDLILSMMKKEPKDRIKI